MPPRPFESSHSSRAPEAPVDEPSEKSAIASLPRRYSSVGFWSLIVTQFQTAFNDNALKFLVIYIVVAIHLTRMQREVLDFPSSAALFALPFIFFSMAGGYFADKYSKRSVTIGTKFLEIAVMLFAIFALLHSQLAARMRERVSDQHGGGAVWAVEIWIAAGAAARQAALVGKRDHRAWDFFGFHRGDDGCGFLAMRYHGREYAAGLILLAATFAGLAASFGISRVPAADPARKFRVNPFGDLWSQCRIIGADRVLTWAVLGNTYLWFLAALLQFTIIIFGHDVLQVDDEHIAYLQAAVALGIGVGSLAAGYLSGGKIEYGLIPLGAVGMTVFGAFLYHPGQTMISTARASFAAGLFRGIFHRAAECADSASARAGAKGRSDRGGESVFVRGDFSCGVLRICFFRAASVRRRREFFSMGRC